MTEHLRSIGCFIGSGLAFVFAQGAKLVGQLDQSGSFNIIEKYIKEGGTALSIVLLLAAVIYLVRENRSQGKRIEALHQDQIKETAASTEARLAQTQATENSNRVVERLAGAVDKLSDKVKT